MKNIERKSFTNWKEFIAYAWKAAPLVYYYVFNGTPDQRMLDALGDLGPDEALILLDVTEDQGLLRDTKVAVDISPEHEFITRSMGERSGLGAWARGALLDFATEPSEVGPLIEYSRKFAFPPKKPS